MEAATRTWVDSPDAVRIEQYLHGTAHRFHVAADADTGPDGPVIPVDVIVGARHHPCLALVAGVHGDEYEGMITLQAVAREIAPEQIAGSLIVIPVANPYAFAAAQRRTPDDDTDLNRVFPGTPDGSRSERLADRLSRGVLSQADLIFTLHGATARGTLAPWVEFLDVPGVVGQATYAAARASGFSDLIALPRLPGVLLAAMAALGVPLIEGEVGGRGATTPENVAYYRARVEAVMRHAGLLPPDAAPADSQPRIWHLSSVEAGARGIFRRGVTLGQDVAAGELLGEILDLHGDPITTVRAPQAGRIGGYLEHVGVDADARVITLWLPASSVNVLG